MKHLKWSIFFAFGLTLAYFFIQHSEFQADRLGIEGKEIAKPKALPAFHLADVEGNTFDNESINDKWTMIFFGFTRCPSICPMAMSYLKGEIAKLDDVELRKLRFLMVSIDPDHDNPEKLKEFVNRFDPAIQAVTGQEDQLKIFAGSFHAAFSKESQDPKNIDLYTMAHSPKFFLVDPFGYWRAYYDTPLAAGLMAQDLKKVLAAKT